MYATVRCLTYGIVVKWTKELFFGELAPDDAEMELYCAYDYDSHTNEHSLTHTHTHTNTITMCVILIPHRMSERGKFSVLLSVSVGIRSLKQTEKYSFDPNERLYVFSAMDGLQFASLF